jgi:hypothetical protein
MSSRPLAGAAVALLGFAALASGCGGDSNKTGAGATKATPSAEIEGRYSMSASNAEIEAAPRHQPGVVDSWGSFRLVLREGRFRFADHRPNGAEPGVNCEMTTGICAEGTTTGRYVIRGTRIEFRQAAGTGDTPMGQAGDFPIVCRWSLYRGALTFHLITNLPRTLDAGPPLLYVKPWRREAAPR